MRVTLATAILLSALSAGVFAQSLGDAARKEQERRAKNAQAGVKARSVDDDQLHAGTGTGKGTINTLSGSATTPSADATPSGASGAGQAVQGGGATGVVDKGGTSDTDRLKAKIAYWRDQYRPVKARADALQREVAELEERVARIGQIAEKPGLKTADVRTGAERDTERLPIARADLARAQRGLAAIEEAARRDGVSAAQLY